MKYKGDIAIAELVLPKVKEPSEELEGLVINVSNNGYFVRINNNTDIFCKVPKNVNASRGDIVKIHILGKDSKTMRIWGKLEELIEEKSEYNNSSEFFKENDKI